MPSVRSQIEASDSLLLILRQAFTRAFCPRSRAATFHPSESSEELTMSRSRASSFDSLFDEPVTLPNESDHSAGLIQEVETLKAENRELRAATAELTRQVDALRRELADLTDNLRKTDAKIELEEDSDLKGTLEDLFEDTGEWISGLIDTHRTTVEALAVVQESVKKVEERVSERIEQLSEVQRDVARVLSQITAYLEKSDK